MGTPLAQGETVGDTLSSKRFQVVWRWLRCPAGKKGRDVDGIADLRRFASEMASACARIQIDSGGELENSRWMGCELRASRLAARDLAEFAAAVRRRLMMLAGLNRSQKEL